ncbi:protein SAWADEE HOMEODOMAIN HOMOLOG 2 isoform X2 [Rhodamnia argentea]|uniref:Protein SAWADEE HOMEODOMAIN HOMOLOG 2 isoform X2 n=1 Tax=Rhodamnia argentea TaxID=178133 RepID=A0A8B8QSE8_9MYRT|nr:protein SAWADEE HOMEODOMAIN HOMOLOG 2 isoform X2 [Rhodamnia argentea]
MGRPPSNGGPAFRFTPPEVIEMEAILQQHNNTMPAREVLVALAEKFSNAPERKGLAVQMKQVWNWFQNKRYSIRAKTSKVPGKLNVSPFTRDDSIPVRNVMQPMAAPVSAPMPAPTVPPSAGRAASDNTMEFEAKSARDGAWYDVSTFLAHRNLESGDPEVLVRFSGFGAEEDEWINIRKHVRMRSLPCESSECVAVLPGDLILCFQEGKDQALYFDAHVLDAQRRRHDVRGCRCRFLVRYDHDESEEIVPLRKVCRRPETDYRLQQLHATDSASADQPKTGIDSSTGLTPRTVSSAEMPQKQQVTCASPMTPVSCESVPSVTGAANVERKATPEAGSIIQTGSPNIPPSAAAVSSATPAGSADQEPELK